MHGPGMKPVMSPAQKEALQKQIEQGNQARNVRDAAGDLFDIREQQILREAVAAFRSTPLDGNTALRYLACLSEVRALKEELEYRDRKGREATDALMSGPTAGEPAAERS